MEDLHYFLLSGHERGPISAVTEKLATPPEFLLDIIEQNEGVEAVKVVQEFCADHNPPDAVRVNCIYALAVFAKTVIVKFGQSDSHVAVKNAAHAAFPIVCPKARHLLKFVDIYQSCHNNRAGWGRSFKKTIRKWYESHDALDLAKEVTSCVEIGKWTHKDVMKLSHLRKQGSERDLVMSYAIFGYGVLDNHYPDRTDAQNNVMSYISDVYKAKHATEVSTLAGLIDKRQLDIPQVSNAYFGNKEIWRALLPHMSLRELLVHLPKLASLKLLDPQSSDSVVELVCDKMKNEERIVTENIHPFSVLGMLVKYEEGKKIQGKHAVVTWKVVPDIVNAATKMIDLCIKHTKVYKPQRTVLAVHINSRPDMRVVEGSKHLIATCAAAATYMLLSRDKQPCHLMGYSITGVQSIGMNQPETNTLNQISRQLFQVASPVTNPEHAINHALEMKLEVDCFVVMTNANASTNINDTYDVLEKYRQQMNIPDARLVLWDLKYPTFNSVDDKGAHYPGVQVIHGFNDIVVLAATSFIECCL